MKRRYLFWLLALAWLPAGLLLQAAVRFLPRGGAAAWTPELFLMAGVMMVQSLIPVAVCGLPLALACRRIWRLDHRRTAWILGAGLGAATLFVTVLAGLLGPLAILIAVLVLSLPAWITALCLARRKKQREGVPDGRRDAGLRPTPASGPAATARSAGRPRG